MSIADDVRRIDPLWQLPNNRERNRPTSCRISRGRDGEERQDWQNFFEKINVGWGRGRERSGGKRETMLHKLVEQSFLKAVGSNEILMTFSWVKRSRQSRWLAIITGSLLPGWGNRPRPPPPRKEARERWTDVGGWVGRKIVISASESPNSLRTLEKYKEDVAWIFD